MNYTPASRPLTERAPVFFSEAVACEVPLVLQTAVMAGQYTQMQMSSH